MNDIKGGYFIVFGNETTTRIKFGKHFLHSFILLFLVCNTQVHPVYFLLQF